MVLLLLRRGGYGVGRASQGGALAASKVGTRYVQSRTAAGGWSQHRFARRRDNQAAGLIDTAAAHRGAGACSARTAASRRPVPSW